MYTVLMNNDELQHILASYFELITNSKMYSVLMTLSYYMDFGDMC